MVIYSYIMRTTLEKGVSGNNTDNVVEARYGCSPSRRLVCSHPGRLISQGLAGIDTLEKCYGHCGRQSILSSDLALP